MKVTDDSHTTWFSVAVDAEAASVAVETGGAWHDLIKRNWSVGLQPVFATDALSLPAGTILRIKVTAVNGSVAVTESFSYSHRKEIIPQLSGDVGPTPTSTPTPTQSPTPAGPVISSFGASPSVIAPGASATLSWSVSGATSLAIDQGVGAVMGTQVTVTPGADTTYTLTAVGTAGTTTSQAKVIVRSLVPGAWSPLKVELDSPNNSDVYSWLDSSKQLRTAMLARNDKSDPWGSKGGMMRALSYHLADGTLRTVTGTGNSNWNGHGYVVNHYGNTAFVGNGTGGTYRKVFTGAHHAIHEFKISYTADGIPITATIHWFMATGQDHPVYAITFDCSKVSASVANKTAIDSRAPYGDMGFEGDNQAQVSGLGWGDKYRFTTTGNGPISLDSPWSYAEANVVPYVLEWINTPDAEEGLVETQSWEHHRTGGSWFYGNWGLTSANPNPGADNDCFRWDEDGQIHSLPKAWQWPYQLNQYELSYENGSASKRMAWGLKYGAVGQSSCPDYGDGTSSSGYPYRSYSVFEVFGQHSTQAVLNQVTSVAHRLAATLVATKGTLATQGPGGVGRNDTVTYDTPGYNEVYSAYELTADGTGAFAISLNPAGGAVFNPVFQVHGAKGLPAVLTLEGKTLVADQDYFASFDATGKVLWLTLNAQVSTRKSLEMTP